MLREGAESGRRQEALSGSLTHVAHLWTSAKNPPPYGAQHYQEALWEGGNEALPPLWHQYKTANGTTRYQEDTLMITSSNRPLPGVRLDFPGQHIPGCEWHISPLGRSYFVNHNTRTTSWKKPTPERPAESLTPEYIIKGHSRCIWSLACLGTSGNIMSASDDGSIRQWKRDGESVGKPLENEGGLGIATMAVSSDETMVICGSVDGRLRLWNIEEGSMIGDPWEGHDDTVRSLDWSPNALEIISGSEDGTIRRWNPNTGRQIAPPIKTSHGWVFTVKYSPQGDKFASVGDGAICIWSREGDLVIKIKGHEHWVMSLCWSKDSVYIFSGSLDDTIRKWRVIDGKELVIFRGHTNPVRSLCLSLNESYLVSASNDCSVRIWDLKTNQAVGDPLLHDDELSTVAISPDGKYIVSAGLDKKIYVWSLEAALKVAAVDDGDANLNVKVNLKGRPVQPRVVRQPIASIRGSAKYVTRIFHFPVFSILILIQGNDFFADDSNPRAAPSANSSLPNWRSLFGSLRFSARPTDATQPSPRESRHRNFSLLPVGKSSRAVDVAAARDEDRYGITPETDAEAAAAMQRTSDNEADDSTQPGHLESGVQSPQVRPVQAQTHGSTGEPEDTMYEGVSCCGFFFGRRRSTSPRS